MYLHTIELVLDLRNLVKKYVQETVQFLISAERKLKIVFGSEKGISGYENSYIYYFCHYYHYSCYVQ